MNPVEWLKTLYGWLGADHPKASLIGAIVLGAVLGGIVWKFAAYAYIKGGRVITTPQPVQPVNSTTGPQSPIMPGNSGDVTITSENSGSNQSPPKGKPK